MSRNSEKARKAEALSRNTKVIHALANKYDLDVKHLNSGYQLRVEGLMDIYPVGQRWHWLPTNERGDWMDGKHLRSIMLRKLSIPVDTYRLEKTMNARDSIKEIKIPEHPMWPPRLVHNMPKVSEDWRSRTIYNATKNDEIKMFYKKPKWYQWRLKRKYRKLLETK